MAIQSVALRSKYRSTGFTKVTGPITAYAHLHGMNIHLYLDDWLINPGSREDSARRPTLLTPRLGSKSGKNLGIKFDNSST